MVPRARLVAPFALAALSAAAALSLGRVFASDRYVVPVLVAVALAHGAGALARWRSFPLWATFLLQAGALVAFAVLALGPELSVLGLSLGGSSISLAEQLERGWQLLRTAPPPAPVTDGALLLAVIVSFVMAAIGDWLAFRRDTVLAATAPALVLFVWASTLGTADGRTATVLGFAAAAAAFLLVQNVAVLDRSRNWLVSQQAEQRHWVAPAVLLVVAAVAIGAVLAPAVPGAGADPVLDFANTGNDGHEGGSYRTGVAPLVDVSAKLEEVDDRELFTVRSPEAEYWRVAALDRLSSENGGQWTLQASGDEVEIGLPSPASTDGLLHQEYDIGPLGERWLPAAYRPVTVNLDDTLVVRSSSTLVADAESVEGLRYAVDSAVAPGEGQVTPGMQAATARPVPARLEPFTEVPGDLPTQIATLAQQIVADAGATTPFAKAQALRDYFRTDAFAYTLDVEPVDTPNAILVFLDEKRGFCVQFSTAYAVMARTLGIPTRVAVGFTPGDEVAGEFRVSSHDAHAWPEVWLAGIEWTGMFDPTPAAGTTAGAGGSDVPEEPELARPPPAVEEMTEPTLPPPTGPPEATGGSGSAPPPTAAPAPTPVVTTESADDGSSPWLPVLAVVAAVAALRAGGWARRPTRCAVHGRRRSTSCAARTCPPIPRSHHSSWRA
jgi:transglutaminase-like putative cysteine protease